MTYNIITPMSRYGNLETLILHLNDQMGVDHALRWHVITDRSTLFKIYFKQDWIEHYECPNEQLGFWQRCNYSINWWLSNFALKPDEYYCFLNDDDLYEFGFFNSLKAHQQDLIITSMKRGQHTPPNVHPDRAHGIETLVAAPENMAPCRVGIEQMVVKGRILSPCRIPMSVSGDGEMIQWICQNHEPTFVPDAYVLFNRLEPGRWD